MLYTCSMHVLLVVFFLPFYLMQLHQGTALAVTLGTWPLLFSIILPHHIMTWLLSTSYCNNDLISLLQIHIKNHLHNYYA
jgi:hypothetical protein